MKHLILPNIYVEHISNPIIFLAGPIRSAPNWQDEAVSYLFSKSDELTIVSPRRGVRESIAQYVAKGDETHFPRQRAWERHYLPRAAKTGSIIFWLPGEESHDCNKVYGAMTRIEIGQWMTEYRHDNSLKLVIGSDGKFSEIHTIEFDLSLDAPDKIIHSTLEETCDAALDLTKLDKAQKAKN